MADKPETVRIKVKTDGTLKNTSVTDQDGRSIPCKSISFQFDADQVKVPSMTIEVVDFDLEFEGEAAQETSKRTLSERVSMETLVGWRERAKVVRIFGEGILDLGRDDLVAVVGYLSQEHERQAEEIKRWMKKAIPGT